MTIIVYLRGKDGLQLVGFYLWIQNFCGGESTFIAYGHPPKGMLSIISTALLYVVPVGSLGPGSTLSLNPDLGLVHDNYCKDCRSWQYYGLSYEDYITSIVDNLIDGAKSDITQLDQSISGVGMTPLCNELFHEQITPIACIPGSVCIEHDLKLVQQPKLGQNDEHSITDRDIFRPSHDFNYPNKLTGYLAQESTEFEFIGPDRQPVVISSIDQLMVIAGTIRSTHVPKQSSQDTEIIWQ